MKDIYEDDESLKMLDIIRENAKTKIPFKIRKTLLEKIEIVFISLSIIFMIVSMFFIIRGLAKEQEEAIVNCINKGNAINYCERISGYGV